MSTFENLKLSNDDFAGKLVANLPDKPSQAGLTAQQLKEWFDRAVLEVVVPRLNQALAELAAPTASENIGSAEIPSLLDPEDETQPALTVRRQLLALRQAIDDLLVGQLPAGAIGETRLANYAVTTSKIADGAVTEEKMAAGAVDYDHLTAALAGRVDAALGVSNEVAQAALFPETLPPGRLAELQADETAGPQLENSGVARSRPECGTYAGLTGTPTTTFTSTSVTLATGPGRCWWSASRGAWLPGQLHLLLRRPVPGRAPDEKQRQRHPPGGDRHRLYRLLGHLGQRPQLRRHRGAFLPGLALKGEQRR